MLEGQGRGGLDLRVRQQALKARNRRDAGSVKVKGRVVARGRVLGVALTKVDSPDQVVHDHDGGAPKCHEQEGHHQHFRPTVHFPRGVPWTQPASRRMHFGVI